MQKVSKRYLLSEAKAGLTTFLAMSYILAVNPQILGSAITLPGIDLGPQLLTATAIAAAAGCLMMGAFARYPFAMAPGMGLNAYIAFTVCGTMALPWQSALAACFAAGLIFLLLSVSGLRSYIVDAIPNEIKQAMTAGIGMFLAIIGLNGAGIVVANKATLVGLGDLSSPAPALACLGLIVISALMVRGFKGALLGGILLVTVIAIAFDLPVYRGDVFTGFSGGVAALPIWPGDIFGKLDFTVLASGSIWLVVLSIVLVDFFDTAGTLYGVADKAGFLDSRGRLARSGAAFAADAVATSVGALVGTSPVTTYVESATGVEAGGRGGLTAIIVGLFFLLSLFFWPLFTAIPAAATAPALIIVGAMMMSGVSKLPWQDYRVAIPCFLTIIGMPLTYSISNGIAFGIISWVLLNHLTGRSKSVSLLMNILALILAYKILH